MAETDPTKLSYESIREVIEQAIRRRDIAEALRRRNPEVYELWVSEGIKKIFENDLHHSFLEAIGSPVYGGIHYVSHYLGRWFRFNFKGKDDIGIEDGIGKTNINLLERAYERVPTKFNLLTFEDLKKNSQIMYSFLEGSGGDRIFALSEDHMNAILHCLHQSSNYFEFFSGGPFVWKVDSQVRSAETFNDWLQEKGNAHPRDTIKDLLKDWYTNCLAPNIVVGRKPFDQEAELDYDHLFRLLSFSIAYTLFAWETYRKEKDEGEEFPYHFGLVLPIRYVESEANEDGQAQKSSIDVMGGFGGLYKEVPKEKDREGNLKNLQEFLEILFNYLNGIEAEVLRIVPSKVSVQAEDTIRLCSDVSSSSRIVEDRSKYAKCLIKRIEDQQKEFKDRYRKQGFCKDCHATFHGTFKGKGMCYCDRVKESILNKLKLKGEWGKRLIGGSEVFISFIEKVTQAIYEEWPSFLEKVVPDRQKRSDEQEDEPKGYVGTIFIYGEEGVGKQIIPRILHCANPRFYCINYLGRSLYQAWREAEDDFWATLRATFRISQHEPPDLKAIEDPKSTQISSLLSYIMSQVGSRKFLRLGKNLTSGILNWRQNFVDLNAAAFDKTEFNTTLFGNRTDGAPGYIQKMSILAGTIFLDEIDKANPEEVNKLLKVIEDPFEYEVILPRKDSTDRYIAGGNKATTNLMFIFNSNKKWEEMNRSGRFSSAFIYRIGKHRFTIPPLRERREDIALFLCHELGKWRDPQIKIIDPHGLRLLCELPWPNNYRGLMGFLGTLKTERQLRGIKSSRISFDEILESLRILELVQSRSHKKSSPESEEM